MFRRLLGATLLASTLAFTGCTSSPPAATSPTPSDRNDAAVDLSALRVHRSQFCQVLSREDAEQALAGPVASTGHYRSGEEAELAPGYVDVAHEHACVYTGADGATATSWVFARPVGRREARRLVRRERERADCAFLDSMGFGAPGLSSACEMPGEGKVDPVTLRVRLTGLFGASWVGCEVAEPSDRSAGHRQDLVERAQQWCTEVVTAMSARP